MKHDIDEDRAVSRLMRYLAVEGITGREKAIAETVIGDLVAFGIPRKAIRFDDANRRIPYPTQTGNLIVNLPGTKSGPRLLFMTHLDTVPLCAGAKPVRRGKHIVAAGETALGGDNRTGVACLMTLIATLLEEKIDYPPLTLLFTVREESGLWGARNVDLDNLGRPAMGFNVDGGLASELVIGAVGAERWEVEIQGIASHAGAHPERGVSATLVAALALEEVHRGGWFGKVRIDGKEGSSNIGSFGGKEGKSAGNATNVVTDYVHLRGESRSHDLRFVKAITSAYKTAFRGAAGRVRNVQGKCAKMRFRGQRDYFPFRLKEKTPVVNVAATAAEQIGLKPRLKISNGGLDANWMVRHGLPTVTFGAGQNGIHAIGEYVEIAEFLTGCRLALAVASSQ